MKEIKIHNHGFVRLIDHMGSDESIVKAARQSYNESPGEYSEEKMQNLIRYLMRHNHSSPFEMAEMVFQIKAPIFVFRQWHRHRTASINEISGRYSELPMETYEPDVYYDQAETNKQGRSNVVHSLSENFKELNEEPIEESFRLYQEMIAQGVSKEQARMHLPLSTYSVMTWKCNLRNLLHFLKLRMDSHAQQEIRDYAYAIAEFVAQLFPITWQAFLDYQFDAVTFSRQEMDFIRWITRYNNDYNFLIREINCIEDLSEREKKEFIEKLNL